MNTILSHEPHIAEAALTPEQAVVYELLIKNGSQRARDLALKTPFSRPLVYKVLEELTELDLIEKEAEKGSVTTFRPKHPQNLADLAERRRAEAEIQYKSTVAAAESLISDFNLMSGKPGVRFYEGIEGMSKIYDDILKTGEDFFLIRPAYEPVFEARMVPIIKEFVRQRVKRDMKVYALTPRDGKSDPSNDDFNLFHRTWVEKHEYEVPVEINIYGNQVAILSYGKELIGVVLESAQIASALKALMKLVINCKSTKES